MFGPNQIPYYSHREPKFEKLFRETIDLFKLKFNTNGIVLLITGSGTVANECVISSSKNKCTIGTLGGFSDRLHDTAIHYIDSKEDGNFLKCGVRYETGISKLYDCTNLHFVDCVSSFPYYTPQGKIWSTVSSKQLGSLTGLSIVCIDDEYTLNSLFKQEEPTYFSLRRYFEKSKINQTPNTPSISCIENFNNILKNITQEKVINKIDSNYGILKEHFNKLSIPIIGKPPVLTVNREFIKPHLIKKYNLYKSGQNIQFFCWTGNEKDYIKFTQEV